MRHAGRRPHQPARVGGIWPVCTMYENPEIVLSSGRKSKVYLGTVGGRSLPTPVLPQSLEILETLVLSPLT